MKLSVNSETWPLREAFTISRGGTNEACVIVVIITDGGHQGRGECAPCNRYGETIENVQRQIVSVKDRLESGFSRETLNEMLPAGAARNALDCALWDLESKREKETVWDRIGITEPRPVATACTIALDTPDKMAERAANTSQRYSLLKIKLGAGNDEERLRKIRKAVPKSRLIVDANEGWAPENLKAMVRACESARVELIEQPLPSTKDNVLIDFDTPIPICADESVHTTNDLLRIREKYDAVNVKLDKTGGLTEALAVVTRAKEYGLIVMVGCMISTSLSMAPATVVAQYADYTDLDGPLLLAKDRDLAIKYQNGAIFPTTPPLWG